MVQLILLYRWHFSHYSVPIHWLVHGHMTSNNETVYRQMPWAGNIAKTTTSNRKQFSVTHKMLTTVARGQSVQLKVAWCCHRNIRAFFKICFCFYQAFLLYNKSLNNWSLGQQWLFRLPRMSMFPETLSQETLRFLGNKIHCSPRDQSLSVYCYVSRSMKASEFCSCSAYFCNNNNNYCGIF